jgi:CDGSH-type Zn-finger protein
MAEPVVVQKAPYVRELAPGDYLWCACGLSKSQPLCDGSHKGSGLSPKRFTVPGEEKVFLCGCKHAKNAPFCDGTHKRL